MRMHKACEKNEKTHLLLQNERKLLIVTSAIFSKKLFSSDILETSSWIFVAVSKMVVCC
jgi:hypothetical protein